MIVGIRNGLMLLAVICVGFSANAVSAVPGELPFSGVLTFSTGAPYEGSVDVTARIYLTETGGTDVWAETVGTVPVSAGSLGFVLGAANAIPDGLLANSTLWLELQLGDTTLTDRFQILSVPFARRAGTADDASSLGGIPASSYATDAELAATPATATAAATAPASPTEGELWFDTSSGALNVYEAGVWTAVSASGSSGSSDGAVPNWPDAINCRWDFNGQLKDWLFVFGAENTAGLRYYASESSNGTDYRIFFNADGTYDSATTGIGNITCAGKSITQIRADGDAFDFVPEGAGGGGGGGATALGELTDVDTTGAVHGDSLRFDGTEWVASPVTGQQSAIVGWPDAINCRWDNGGTFQDWLFVFGARNPSNQRYYVSQDNTGGAQRAYFDAAGNFVSHTYAGNVQCDGKSITQLYAEGNAFNFGGDTGCPAGFSEVGELGCILTAARPAQTCQQAVADCISTYGGRLPSYSESYAAIVALGLSGERQWVDSAGWASGTGSWCGVMTEAAFDNRPSWDPIASSVAYRCFVPK